MDELGHGVLNFLRDEADVALRVTASPIHAIQGVFAPFECDLYK